MDLKRRAVLAAPFFGLWGTACGRPDGLETTLGKPAAEPIRYDAAFWETWGDGFAEVSTYDLRIPRYGEMREGESILIFVSETMSERQRLKADPGKNPKADEFSVMKMNWQRNFQTGIYDYSEMLSAFLGLAPMAGRPAGTLAKLSWSRQEWCGHMFQEALFDAGRIRARGMSYFDGEADLAQILDNQPGGLAEDSLLFWARQMAHPFLKPGESKSVPFLTGIKSARDAHRPLVWSRAQATRQADGETIEVGMGEIDAEVYTVELDNGKLYTIHVEEEAPHRIVRWEYPSGEIGELFTSERVKYWELNSVAGEAALGALGLERRAPRFVPEE